MSCKTKPEGKPKSVGKIVVDPIKAKQEIDKRYREYYLEQDYYKGIYGTSMYNYPGIKKNE